METLIVWCLVALLGAMVVGLVAYSWGYEDGKRVGWHEYERYLQACEKYAK